MRTPKLFIGQYLRELRDEQAMTQAQFAEQLGISTSYLNQLENNQRHVTASVLLALAERFSVNIADLSRQDSDRLMADLLECYADPIFDGKAPSARELRLAAQNSPGVALSVITMHQALRRASDQLAEMDDTITRSGVIGEPTPYEEVRDYFHFKNNYVDELDLAAESLAAQLAGKLQLASRNDALRQYLMDQHSQRWCGAGRNQCAAQLQP
jgi:transcriptional regulator with XRE-family HTH domain